MDNRNSASNLTIGASGIWRRDLCPRKTHKKRWEALHQYFPYPIMALTGLGIAARLFLAIRIKEPRFNRVHGIGFDSTPSRPIARYAHYTTRV